MNLIFGMTAVALLASTSSQMHMVSASVEGGFPGSNASNSNQGATDISCELDPYKCVQQATDHINQAQSALQNGDIEGANNHLDLAKKSLGCTPMDPRC